jgi:hypothetical protein
VTNDQAKESETGISHMCAANCSLLAARYSP